MKLFKMFMYTTLIWGVAALSFQQAHATDSGPSSDNRIIDCAGRAIQVEKPFTRIISLYAAHTENLFHLGLDKEIIGVSGGEGLPSAAAVKPRFSPRDGPEKFLAARPDLVLIRPMIDRGYAPLVLQLEKFGVVAASLQPSGPDDMYDYWRTLGILTGKKAEAEKMVEEFRQGLDRIHALVETIEKSDRKRVYFEAIHSKMKTFSPGAMPIFALETAGGVNLAKDAVPVRGTNIAFFGKERILSLADRIDVYLAQYGPMNRPTIGTIMEEPGFSVIKAIKENNVHLVDETLASRPTMRLLEAIAIIGKILYPGVFTDKAVSEIVKTASRSGPADYVSKKGNAR